MKHSLDLHRNRRAWRQWDGRRAGFRRRGSRFGLHALGGILLAGLAGALAWAMLPMPGSERGGVEAVAAAAPARAFGLCHVGGGANCVVDGDTFWIDGVKIRIADIDTPETHPARCAHEAELGAAATRRLQALLSSGAVAMTEIERDADRYGRKLRLVSVDGRPVGATLVIEGLARRYEGGMRGGWCA